jgi:hypothetical protein
VYDHNSLTHDHNSLTYDHNSLTYDCRLLLDELFCTAFGPTSGAPQHAKSSTEGRASWKIGSRRSGVSEPRALQLNLAAAGLRQRQFQGLPGDSAITRLGVGSWEVLAPA